MSPCIGLIPGIPVSNAVRIHDETNNYGRGRFKDDITNWGIGVSSDVDRYYVSKLVRLCDRIKSITEQDSNLLDQTVILYGSGMNSGQGGGHSPKNLPLLLAGGGWLGFRHGKHLSFEIDRVPLSNLLLSLLRAMGVERDRFADSTGTLRGLT